MEPHKFAQELIHRLEAVQRTREAEEKLEERLKRVRMVGGPSLGSVRTWAGSLDPGSVAAPRRRSRAEECSSLRCPSLVSVPRDSGAVRWLCSAWGSCFPPCTLVHMDCSRQAQGFLSVQSSPSSPQCDVNMCVPT